MHTLDPLMLARTRRVQSVSTVLLLSAVVLLQTACSGRTESAVMTASANGTLGDSLPTRAADTQRMGAMRMETVAASPLPAQQAVLEQLAQLGGKPMVTLPPAEARLQPTPADAVAALLKSTGRPTTPEAVGTVINRTFPGPGGAVPIRVYSPVGDGPFPVVVYFHGGGFVIADLDTYDASARALTNAANAIVVSVQYRKAPEHKFPAAHDDAYAAYQWAVANASMLGGDPARVALAGESAGGNLALATAIAARDKGIQAPVAVLAVYPIAGTDTNTDSYRVYADAKPLSRPLMQWFFGHYMRTPADAQDTRLNLVAANLAGLPPTTIVSAQIDPLRSEGEMIAARLRAAGVSVRSRTFDGVAHEFFGQGAAVPLAKEAVAFGADGLTSAFARND